MNLQFKNKKITGILNVIPENEIKFEDELDDYNFTSSQSLRLKKVMGYDKRRVVTKGTTVSDLCVFGLNYLFEKKLLLKKDIDAIILVTQSPDHFIPATSHIIHGRLDLKQDIYCLDINQACSGYAIGLFKAFMLLDQNTVKKVVVLNADILSTKISKSDRSSRPLTGDAASITIVEKSKTENDIYGFVKTDGKGAKVLTIPAGGFKMPSTKETAKILVDNAGNSRSLDDFYMKGDDVFNFVQREVPKMIDNLLEFANCKKDEIDYFLFHQPNKFMLKKLAAELDIIEEKMPNDIVEKFGNSGSATIPMTISHTFGNDLKNRSILTCMAGFGAGLSWSALILKLGDLKFNEILDYK